MLHYWHIYKKKYNPKDPKFSGQLIFTNRIQSYQTLQIQANRYMQFLSFVIPTASTNKLVYWEGSIFWIQKNATVFLVFAQCIRTRRIHIQTTPQYVYFPPLINGPSFTPPDRWLCANHWSPGDWRQTVAGWRYKTDVWGSFFVRLTYYSVRVSPASLYTY